MNEKEMKKKLKQAYDLLKCLADCLPDYTDGRNDKLHGKTKKWIYDYEDKKNER